MSFGTNIYLANDDNIFEFKSSKSEIALLDTMLLTHVQRSLLLKLEPFQTNIFIVFFLYQHLSCLKLNPDRFGPLQSIR